ncbi:hypothetical protein PC116_g33546 [Phytophthora cactorum]|nr:hypothetical protein PC116_g33546 [Phytophthora cactorum]
MVTIRDNRSDKGDPADGTYKVLVNAVFVLQGSEIERGSGRVTAHQGPKSEGRSVGGSVGGGSY